MFYSYPGWGGGDILIHSVLLFEDSYKKLMQMCSIC